jgi:hypothetical protein
MEAIVEITADGTLKLPADLAARFRPSERFFLWEDGDTLHLKRLSAPPLDVLVDEAGDEDRMSMQEIDEIVHEVRRERRAR